MLNDEMEGRVEQNATSVWEHFKIRDVADGFVSNCCEAIRRDCATHISGFNDVLRRRLAGETGFTESTAYPFLVRADMASDGKRTHYVL